MIPIRIPDHTRVRVSQPLVNGAFLPMAVYLTDEPSVVDHGNAAVVERYAAPATEAAH